MKPAGKRYRSVARRVALLAVAMLSVVLFAISATLTVLSERNERAQLVKSASDNAELVGHALDAFDQTERQMAVRAFQPFRRKFGPNFEQVPDSHELKSWGVVLNNDHSLVDQFHQETGGVATVFVRKGQDFERISTSLTQEDGSRAVGTRLDRQHPAYARMLAGASFTGRANLFGTPYMTHYEAVKNEAGEVVGILFIGFDLSDFQSSIDQLVASVHYFDSGGTYVVDPGADNAAAVFVSHPRAAGRKVLEVQPDAGPFLDRLRQASVVHLSGAAALLNPQIHDAWIVKRTSRADGWWIVAELSDREAMAAYWRTQYVLWGLLALGTAVLGLGLYVIVRRNVSHPLAELTAAVTSVAQGDLSRGFESARRDEIGRLVREVEGMRLRFLDLMRQLRAAADSINTASVEIASGNQDLSSRTEQAVSSLQQTAASMEQLTATVRQSADSALQANQLVSAAADTAVKGGKVVDQVVATMDEIKHSSQKIADIIGVIDGIAFQTNILALNAAVEAARAGEQGRGFAVVASEVRSLAQRSAEAAKEIKALIGNSVDKVQIGSRLVADAGQTMSEIVGSVQRVSDIMGEISAAAGEQSDGIGQVNTAVGQLDRMTQQNAALVEESAAAAESLKDQASRLLEVVQVFHFDGHGMGETAPLDAGPAREVSGSGPGGPAAPAPGRSPVPKPPVHGRAFEPGLAGAALASTAVLTSAAVGSGGPMDEWESF